MVRTYKELRETYKINHFGNEKYENGKWVPINENDYDIIVKPAGNGYTVNKYRIIKNGPRLSADELVEVCDKGGYNFGHRWEGGLLVVYID